jgi:sugar/nucleoside kinase (ribokinase family)
MDATAHDSERPGAARRSPSAATIRRVPQTHLLSAGEAFEDLVFVGLDRLPGAGEEVRTNTFTRTIGGGAPITAVAAARLGLGVTLASGLSDAAARQLRAEGLRVINLRRPGEPHAVSAALSTVSERAFVTFDGVNTKLEPRLARVVGEAATSRATHVHLAFYPRRCAAWATRLRRLRRRGVTFSWDFGWNDVLAKDPELPALMDALDIVFLNDCEAALYSGGDPRFWQRRRSLVVIKQGPEGSRAIGLHGEHAERAPRVTPVDTTGAGDAFNAGFLVRHLGGGTLAESLRAGNRVGAASTQKAGGIEALPRWKGRL